MEYSEPRNFTVVRPTQADQDVDVIPPNELFEKTQTKDSGLVRPLSSRKSRLNGFNNQPLQDGLFIPRPARHVFIVVAPLSP